MQQFCQWWRLLVMVLLVMVFSAMAIAGNDAVSDGDCWWWRLLVMVLSVMAIAGDGVVSDDLFLGMHTWELKNPAKNRPNHSKIKLTQLFKIFYEVIGAEISITGCTSFFIFDCIIYFIPFDLSTKILFCARNSNNCCLDWINFICIFEIYCKRPLNSILGKKYFLIYINLDFNFDTSMMRVPFAKICLDSSV